MDIVISSEPESARARHADGREGGGGGGEREGGGAGVEAGSAEGWTLRYEGSGVITVTFLYLPRRCPCLPTLISALGDWQPTSPAL